MHVTVSNGIRLHLRQWGTGSPSLLMIHGLGDGSHVWEPIARPLAMDYASIAVDLRGHADSSWDPQQVYHSGEHANDIVAVIRELRLRSIVLAGHSLGAEVALQVASVMPSVVKGLVLIDGGPELRTEALDFLRHQFRIQTTCYRSVAEYVAVVAERLPMAEAKTIEAYCAASLRAADGGYRLKCDPELVGGVIERRTELLWNAARSFPHPMLVVRGVASAVFTREAATHLVQSNRQAELVTLPGAGHAVPIDNPSALTATLRTYLDRHREVFTPAVSTAHWADAVES